jgi:hypothetical protein
MSGAVTSDKEEIRDQKLEIRTQELGSANFAPALPWHLKPET